MAMSCANCVGGTYFVWVPLAVGGWEYRETECEKCHGMGLVAKVYPKMEGLAVYHGEDLEDGTTRDVDAGSDSTVPGEPG